MNRRHALALAFVSAASLAVTPAYSQEVPRIGRDGYLLGIPGVIKPPSPPPPPRLTAFEAAYRSAGRPRMVLFFNRDIADTASSAPIVQRRETARVTEDVTASGSRAPVPGDAEGRNERSDISGHQDLRVETTTEVTVRREAQGGRQAPTDEAQQWLFESAFTDRLAADRIRVVDRATAIRIAGLTPIADPQRLETGAIRSYADLVVVVRATPMADGSLLHRVTAIDTRNGSMSADILVPASDVAQGGASAVGKLAADRLVARLIAAWTPAR